MLEISFPARPIGCVPFPSPSLKFRDNSRQGGCCHALLETRLFVPLSEHPIDSGAVDMSDLFTNQVSDDSLTGFTVRINGKDYVLQHFIGAGTSGAVWKATDEFGRVRAVKLAKPEHYANRAYSQELAAADKLREHNDLFASLFDAGPTEIVLAEDRRISAVGFVEEFIAGTTLAAAISAGADRATPAFFVAYTEQLCRALSALNACQLQHDDLNMTNVMIVPPPAGDLDGTERVRIIDMASLKATARPTRKLKNDLRRCVIIWSRSGMQFTGAR